jgi:pyruvate dehydrogenase E1 component
MYQEQEDVYYYITVMNENYAHPAMPEGVEKGVLKGMYLLREGKARKNQLKVQLLGSGTILREVIAGADLLEQDFSIAADIWSVTSFNELRRDGLAAQRWNLLHAEAEPRLSYVEQCLKGRAGAVIAATDYVKAFADQIRAFLPTHHYIVLGTDGFGRSDTRAQLRKFFEVDRHYVAVAALKALADQEALPRAKVTEAIKKYGIDPEKPNPTTV